MSGAAYCMPWLGLLDDTLHFGLLSWSWPWSASCCTHKLTRAFFPSQLPAGNHGGACATFVEKALVSREAGKGGLPPAPSAGDGPPATPPLAPGGGAGGPPQTSSCLQLVTSRDRLAYPGGKHSPALLAGVYHVPLSADNFCLSTSAPLFSRIRL